ncbi:MAG: anti sigma factor C-terminal domain-containing protein [Alkalibacterium sp.]|nr:anti sigma factor C-terminal domain-containing protein [Alkalibacterium sp.]
MEFHEELKQRENDITLDYVDTLNPLSYISMSIVFEEDLTMTELYDLSSEYSELDIKWAGIRTTEPGTVWSDSYGMNLIGFNPDPDDEPSSNRQPDSEEYPLFYLNDVYVQDESFNPFEDFPEAYETHFKSRLNYIRNQEEFVELVNYSTSKTDFYEDALKYIDENGVETYGIRVYGTAEAFSEHIGDLPYASLFINEVAASKPNMNIYYD